jgi:hypothetical protein
VRHRLVRASWRGGVRRENLGPFVARGVVQKQVAERVVLPSPSTTSPPNSTIVSGFCLSVAVHEQLQRGEGFSQSTRISTSVRFASRSLMEAKMASMSSPALAFAARALEFRRVLVRLPVRLGRAGGALGLLPGALRQLLALVPAGTHGGGAPSTRARGARKSE